MKKFSVLLILGLIWVPVAALAGDAEVSLEDQLQGLELPSHQAPAQVSSEQLYAVQNRYLGLDSVGELSLGAGKNFTGDSFLVSQEIGLSYRHHFGDRWSLGATASYGFNSLSTGGKRLLDERGLFPDVAYVKSKAELSVARNMLYGKLRLGMDRVLYFDQYLGLGVGAVNLNSGTQPAAVIEAGMVFWLGRSGSFRFGAKDSIYNEKRLRSSGVAHNIITGISVGYLFGGEKTI